MSRDGKLGPHRLRPLACKRSLSRSLTFRQPGRVLKAALGQLPALRKSGSGQWRFCLQWRVMNTTRWRERLPIAHRTFPEAKVLQDGRVPCSSLSILPLTGEAAHAAILTFLSLLHALFPGKYLPPKRVVITPGGHPHSMQTFQLSSWDTVSWPCYWST